jgi:hypothetical protein
MSSKLQILLSLVESFDKNKNNPKFSKKQLAVYIATSHHFKKQALDQAWYAEIAHSFIEAINKDQNPHDWMAEQLKQLGIYQASNSFQGDHIQQDYHCMSFASDLLHGKQIKRYCNADEPFPERMSSYIKDSKAKQISKQELKTGDLVVYRAVYLNQELDYIHVAVFIENIKGELYAISKFGLTHKVFIHRTQDVVDSYREASFYRSKFKLDSNTPDKFLAIKEELHSSLQPIVAQEIKHTQVAQLVAQLPTVQEEKQPIKKATHEMKGFGTKLRSGFVHSWSWNKNGINEEEALRIRPNADPVFRR